ncbi:hypothetical protein JCM5350_004582 [Sporobolomyces pararoseus]
MQAGNSTMFWSSPTETSHASFPSAEGPIEHSSSHETGKKHSSESALVSPSMHDAHYPPGQHPHEVGDNPALPKDELEMEEKIKDVLGRKDDDEEC